MPPTGTAPGSPPARSVSIAIGMLLLLLAIGLVVTFAWALPNTAPTATPTTSVTAIPTTPPRPALFSATCRLAAQQLRDGEAADAVATLESVGIADVATVENTATGAATPQETAACAATWTIASAAVSADEPADPTAFAAAGSAWDLFVKTWLTPLTGAAGFIAGGWLALFVVARLLVELPAIRNRSSSKADRVITAVVGWILLFVGPIAFTMVGAEVAGDTGAVGIPVLIAITALALFGAVNVSLWLASLRRMQITVTAGDDLKGTDVLDRVDVITQLRALVGSGRGRIELPAGPQLESLDTALSSLSSIAWVAAVQKAVVFLVGVVPWQITVEQSTDAAASVVVSRHGQLQASDRVSLGEGKFAALNPHDPPGANRLLATFVAATIVSALRAVYRADLDPGLDGATKTSGIALQYIATKWHLGEQPPTRAIDILRTASEEDPFNELARSSLDYAEHRGAKDIIEIDAYIQRLTTRIQGRGLLDFTRVDSLLSSWMLTRAVMTRNRAGIATDGLDILTPADQLRAWLAVAPPADETRLARTSAFITMTALTVINDPTDCRIAPAIEKLTADEAVSANPVLSYSMACLLVRWRTEPFSDPTVARLLETAAHSPVIRSFAPIDPELTLAPDKRGRKAWLAKIAPPKPPKKKKTKTPRSKTLATVTITSP